MLKTLKRLFFLMAVVLCLQLGFCSQVGSAADSPVEVKELNFVFLHGAIGVSCSEQLLADTIQDDISAYVFDYERANPGIKVRVNTLNRCYPGDVDINSWAHNIADDINKRLPGKGGLILIGHSMGGKSALYAVAKNVGNLADRTALVVTIDSPIKRLDGYQVAGGGSFADFCRAALLVRADKGVCASVASYDSSDDGRWVGENRHWLAFIAGENSPLSRQFDYGGLDPFPRVIDDGALPLSAQYCDGADVVYYGEHGHSDFATMSEVADFMAQEILQYIFGGSIECSVFARSGNFGHRAGGLLGTDYWQDTVGDVLGRSGSLGHWNQSYTEWQEWEDVMEYYPPTYDNDRRSRYEASRERWSSLFTGIEEVRWLDPDNAEDCRLYLRTRAAPRNCVRVGWEIYRQGLLPAGTNRDRYEVRIVASTPLASVTRVAWATDDPRDLRLQVWSQAESPFRWFEAEWKVFYKEVRQRKVIDEIPALPEAAAIR